METFIFFILFIGLIIFVFSQSSRKGRRNGGGCSGGGCGGGGSCGGGGCGGGCGG